MAIYAIGDVQGCYDPLRELLDAIRFDPGRDTLWLTGDLVNRGPKSLKTVRFVKSLGDSAITVLGNHDLHLLALAAGQVKYGNRFESLKKLLKAKNSDELLDWIRHLPLAHFDASVNTLLVHAGTHPNWSVKKTLARAAEPRLVPLAPVCAEFSPRSSPCCSFRAATGCSTRPRSSSRARRAPSSWTSVKPIRDSRS